MCNHVYTFEHVREVENAASYALRVAAINRDPTLARVAGCARGLLA
eukprot:COSAG02_NODE_28487_length_588_cov_1.488753_1_plen_45_part_10